MLLFRGRLPEHELQALRNADSCNSVLFETPLGRGEIRIEELTWAVTIGFLQYLNALVIFDLFIWKPIRIPCVVALLFSFPFLRALASAAGRESLVCWRPVLNPWMQGVTTRTPQQRLF